MARVKTAVNKETGAAHDALSSAEKARAYLAALEGDDAAAKIAAEGSDDEALATAKEHIEAADAEAGEAPPETPGIMRVKHPDGATSFNGVAPDAKGVFSILASDLDTALAHGFTRA